MWHCNDVTVAHNGILESGTAREKWPFPWIIYERSGLRKVAVALVRATERSGHLKEAKNTIWGRKHVIICKDTLNFSNYVSVRVPINNYNYE